MKVPYFLYCLGNNGCFQLVATIGMFGLSSKVNRCVFFFSLRIIGVENGGGETYTERRFLGVPKLDKNSICCY